MTNADVRYESPGTNSDNANIVCFHQIGQITAALMKWVLTRLGR